ncbi:hypothetical protein TELCIR_10579 [Teladorsagia circumcincta]|uniref:ISXO2-like transposase domain-containing protein n=1 Tax=Teladorsagia circumcincta TaxID=45464 RepID=A0A2G9UD37_TELCI|nr:hypothetical protein TELCIR_10579 [Teladorsagia circumcincta]
MALRLQDDVWICHRRACRTNEATKHSLCVRHGSFFANSKLPVSTIFAVAYFWLREFGSFRTKSFELGVSAKMLTCWERRFRSICSRFYRRHPSIIGGTGAVVQVDETNVTRRKYNRGRIVRRREWLFGGDERGGGRAFMVLVRRRDAAMLTNIILKVIRPGTIIMSDSWRAYSQLSRLPAGYRHLTVNHIVNFVDPHTDAHTQNIESLWQKFKMVPKRKYGLNTKRYTDYIRELLWRREFGELGEIIFNLFEHIAEISPC